MIISETTQVIKILIVIRLYILKYKFSNVKTFKNRIRKYVIRIKNKFKNVLFNITPQDQTLANKHWSHILVTNICTNHPHRAFYRFSRVTTR